MLNKINIDNKKIPFIFLFLLIASFGLLIPKLGFYWDDWPVIFITQNLETSSFWDFYQYDRPFSAWTYVVTTPILGVGPINWHIFSLLLRWLTVIFLWLSLNKLWPNKSRQTLWIALLFSVYPLFDQQSVAVAYSQHWICYLFYFISIFLMLLAQETNRYYIPLTFSSVFLSLIQMFTMEYFLGLELFRPIILGIYFYNRGSFSNKLTLVRKSFFSSWFYVFFLGVYVIWRVFFLNLAGDDPNDPVFLRELIQTPIKSFFNLIQVALQDLTHFFLSWFTTLDPINIDIRRPFFVASTGVAIGTAFLLWLVLSQYKPPVQSNSGGKWYRQAIVFGIAATLSGTLPVWLIGRQASLGLYGNRFGLAAMFGLSIMLVGFLEWLSDRVSAKNVVICIMIGLAIHTHLYTAKEFQNSWEKQRRVYWQLYWRAPYIEPGTAIIAPGEIFNYVGTYSTSMGITLLYPPTENPQDMPYWFFSMGRGLYTKTEELVAGTPLTDSLRNFSFEGNSQNALLFYLPGENQCMRIVTASDEIDRDVPRILEPVISISNPERIKNNLDQDWSPSKTVFGKEPEHTWCYFFEKAELARQSQNWEQVLDIMSDADQRGYSPANVKEYLPLLEAYLYTNQIDEAQTLTRHIKKLSDRVDDLTCNTWLSALDANPSDTLEAAYQSVEDELNCFD